VITPQLASTQDELVFTKSAFRLLQNEIQSRKTDDAEMEDFDHNTIAGLNRARSENDSLCRKLQQTEREALKLVDTIERTITAVSEREDPLCSQQRIQ